MMLYQSPLSSHVDMYTYHWNGKINTVGRGLQTELFLHNVWRSDFRNQLPLDIHINLTYLFCTTDVPAKRRTAVLVKSLSRCAMFFDTELALGIASLFQHKKRYVRDTTTSKAIDG